MIIDLTPEDVARAERLVASGRYASIEEAVHIGLELAEEDRNWAAYASDRIETGIADLKDGDTVSGTEILARLQSVRDRA